MIQKAEMRDFRQDIEINQDNLEEDWLTHPSLYLYYSDLYAEAIHKKDQAKLKLDLVTAKLDLDIRKNFKNYGFDSKPAEGGIKNTIIVQEETIKAQEELNKKTKILNSFNGVKTAFEHRKMALSNLVSLLIGGFYSEPRNQTKDIKKLQNKKAHNSHKKVLNENHRKKKISQNKNK